MQRKEGLRFVQEKESHFCSSKSFGRWGNDNDQIEKKTHSKGRNDIATRVGPLYYPSSTKRHDFVRERG